MYYLCSGNKGADQVRSYCAADLRLCFRICKISLSQDADHIIQPQSRSITSMYSKTVSTPAYGYEQYKLLIIIMIILSIFKEDNVFSITDSLPYGPPVNTDIDFYRTF